MYIRNSDDSAYQMINFSLNQKSDDHLITGQHDYNRPFNIPAARLDCFIKKSIINNCFIIIWFSLATGQMHANRSGFQMVLTIQYQDIFIRIWNGRPFCFMISSHDQISRLQLNGHLISGKLKARPF